MIYKSNIFGDIFVRLPEDNRKISKCNICIFKRRRYLEEVLNTSYLRYIFRYRVDILEMSRQIYIVVDSLKSSMVRYSEAIFLKT